jgi:hypothetical protein
MPRVMEVLRAVKVRAGEECSDARELEPQQLEALARNVELRGFVGAVPSTHDRRPSQRATRLSPP